MSILFIKKDEINLEKLENLFLILSYCIFVFKEVWMRLGIIFILYFLSMEFKSDIVDIMYVIMYAFLAIIFSEIIIRRLLCLSEKYGFKEKSYFFYNVFTIIYTIFLFILFLILIFFLYKLYFIISLDLINSIKDFVLIGTNKLLSQGGGYSWPGGSNGPGGPNGPPPGPDGPSSFGFHGPQKRSYCGEEDCYTGPNSLNKCLDSFSDKSVRRIIEAENLDQKKPYTPKYPSFRKNSNLDIISNTPLDYTEHELKAFMELVSKTKGEGYIIFKPGGPQEPFSSTHAHMLTSRGKNVQDHSVLYWDFKVNKWDSLTNLNLSKVLKMYKLI